VVAASLARAAAKQESRALFLGRHRTAADTLMSLEVLE
jgi:hypothetical protein